MNAVTVLGLGAMGATLARLFVDRGHEVTVWNRTPAKAGDLAQRGARVADSAAQAVAASPIVVMCVYDYAAAQEILDLPGVASALDGRVLVHLSTGSPEDARRLQAWCERQAAAYLDGAIQAAPSQMGQPDTPLLVSGPQATYERVEPMLRELAGYLVYLGPRIDAAATMDLATLSYVYGAFAGFVHGARLAESQGIDVAQYGALVRAISPSFGAFFEHEGNVIQSGDFRVTESPLRISVEATRRILQAHDAFDRAERQVDHRPPIPPGPQCRQGQEPGHVAQGLLLDRDGAFEGVHAGRAAVVPVQPAARPSASRWRSSCSISVGGV